MMHIFDTSSTTAGRNELILCLLMTREANSTFFMICVDAINDVSWYVRSTNPIIKMVL